VNTPLSDYTILENRAVISHFWAEGVKPADIHRKIVAQYGGVNCVSQRKNPEEQLCQTKLDRGGGPLKHRAPNPPPESKFNQPKRPEEK